MATREEISKLTIDELQASTLDCFSNNRIDGEAFLEITDAELKELVTPLGDRKKFMKLLASYTPRHTVVATPTAHHGGLEHPLWVEDAIPQVFSRSTMQCMEKRLITKHVRCEIGEALSHRVYAATEYPSAAEYTAVCVALVNKYPVLADTYGNGYGPWKQMLRQRMKNLRRPAEPRQSSGGSDKENEPPPAKKQDTRRARTGSVASEVSDPEEYEKNLALLKVEQEKDKPSKRTIRQLMKSTYQGRRDWILSHSPCIETVLKEFPFLKKIRFLERELQSITDGCESIDATLSLRPKILSLAHEEAKQSLKLKKLLAAHNVELELFDSEVKGLLEGVHVLEVVTAFLVPRSKQSIIHRFTMDQNLDEAAMAVTDNHPYLGVVIGDASIEVYLVVERRVMEKVEASSLLTRLIAAYFAFNMSYPKPLYALLIFIQHFLLSIRDKQTVPVSVTKLMSSLDKLDV